MLLYPLLAVFAAVAIVAILVSMYLEAETRSQIVSSLASWGLVLVAYGVCRRRQSAAEVSASAQERVAAGGERG